MDSINICDLARQNILKLKPYSSARSEFTGSSGIFLDANENPYGKLNRYPDPLQMELKKIISSQQDIGIENIFIGNGSDEIIDLAIRVFCEPGRDQILIFTPTYGMYKFLADVNNVGIIQNQLDENFQINIPEFEKTISENNVKLIFICSPNNPTANIINGIDKIFSRFNGIVFIDEAYIEFSDTPSFAKEVTSVPNIIVSRTLSKAYGIAGARVGAGFANKQVISLFTKTKYPYNVSKLNLKAAIDILRDKDEFERIRLAIIIQREFLEKELSSLGFVKKVFPTDANFILIEVENAQKVYSGLAEIGIIVRTRDSELKNCIRITVGSPYENKQLIEALKTLDKKDILGTRESAIKRQTNETNVDVVINIDGSGKSFISTGLNFFDHMLEQIAKHGNIDINITAVGDIMTDEHHTVEDVGIILGEAFNNAIGNKNGIERYGFLLPMDDSLAQVAIDFGGRPYLVWDVSFRREMIGDMPTELFEHFFKSFSDNAKCNINIKAEGENDHHKIEAIFKAFAKSVRQAVSKTNDNSIPSTKGIL
ncbi:MAG: histidinol-phosphate transaminase [Bacteroidetes bacterium]|nr:histidinol-phosphate transaminase [Bacteroidota bacterium]